MGFGVKKKRKCLELAGIPKLEECLHALADWSSANGLSINEGKN